MPGVLKSRLRYARRFSSVHSTLTDLKRFSQVPLDSSAARMPLPFATIAAAVLDRSCWSMRFLEMRVLKDAEQVPDRAGILTLVESGKLARGARAAFQGARDGPRLLDAGRLAGEEERVLQRGGEGFARAAAVYQHVAV